MVETIYPPNLKNNDSHIFEQTQRKSILGFKNIGREITMGSVPMETPVADFVKENFPCSRIIINYSSNLERQANSSWHAQKNHTQQVTELAKLNSRLKVMAKQFGSQAYVLDSALWLKNLTYLNELVSWLGFPPECHFKGLLEFNTKGNGYGHGQTTLNEDHRACLKEHLLSFK